MPGQLRVRVRHRAYRTPCAYPIVSPDELRELCAGTGCTVSRSLRPDGERPHTAVLVRD